MKREVGGVSFASRLCIGEASCYMYIIIKIKSVSNVILTYPFLFFKTGSNNFKFTLILH